MAEVERLLHPTRRALLAALRQHPGATRADLARTLDIAPTTVAHHLAQLACGGHLVPVRGPRGVGYYLNGMAPARPHRDAPGLGGATATRLLDALRADAGLTLADLARHAGVSEKAAYWHLARLERAHLVRGHMEGRAKVYRRDA